MAATTVDVARGDTDRTATVAAGGTPGAKALRVIIDWSKVASLEELNQMFNVAQRTVILQGRGIAQA